MTKEIVLTLLSKPACHLCEEMEEVVRAVGRKIPLKVNHVDVSRDAALGKQYGLDIPLLFHGAECLAKHRAHERTLHAKLKKIAASA